MKTIKLITFILISMLCFDCAQKCPPSAVDPHHPMLYFSVIDSEGNDLFFGENAIYDPYSVKIVAEQKDDYIECLRIYESENYFVLELACAKGAFKNFYAEFIPNKTDTIKIECHFVRWYEEPKGCRHFPINKYEIFFNDTHICTDCQIFNQIYKIELK